MSELRFFKLDRDEVLRRLHKYAEEKVNQGALAVYLVGSLARGDYTAFSDADLVIVVRDDPRRPIDRLTEYIDPTLPLDLEPRVYTLRELEEMATKKNRLVKELVKYGVLLAGDKSILNKLKELFEGNPSGFHT